jgi:hypothetical protein
MKMVFALRACTKTGKPELQFFKLKSQDENTNPKGLHQGEGDLESQTVP